MQFVKNPPRRQRSFLRMMVVCKALPLFIVGPKHTGLKNGGYWYATIHNGLLVAITKRPVGTRDEGRGDEAIHRFGRKASEYRIRNGSYVQAQIIEDGRKVARKWDVRTGRRIAA